MGQGKINPDHSGELIKSDSPLLHDINLTGNFDGRNVKSGTQWKAPLITFIVLAVLAGGIAAAYFAKVPGIHSFIHNNTFAVAVGGGTAALIALMASAALGSNKCARNTVQIINGCC